MGIKQVRFGGESVHYLYVWDFAYRHARKGKWHLFAVDNERFERRIKMVGEILEKVLQQKLIEMELVGWSCK